MSTHASVNHSSSVASAMDLSCRPLIDVVDQLRALGVDEEIDIPQVAVMGDQSSGKSSVLEALSGIPFPRGCQLVTKCATELRMKRGAAFKAVISLTWDKAQPADAGAVGSIEELGEKIEKLTDALLAASGATFEKEHSILIELEAPSVPDLTVIDLPGIVRTSVEGQDAGVIEDVGNLINKYLQRDRTIILAVIPCNVDIATVDILERARNVDPAGDRTIGVLTKPDLIDKGAEAEVISVLRGIRKPLKLGYTILKNRSQQQIDKGISLAEAKAEETGWFSQQDPFKELKPELFGVDNLSQRLTEVLVQRIRHSLPPMIAEIRAKIDVAKRDLAELPVQCQSEAEAKVLCEQLLASFDREMHNIIGGGPVPNIADGEAVSMCAQLHAVFENYDSVLRERLQTFLSPDYQSKVTKVTMQVCSLKVTVAFLHSSVHTNRTPCCWNRSAASRCRTSSRTQRSRSYCRTT